MRHAAAAVVKFLERAILVAATGRPLHSVTFA